MRVSQRRPSLPAETIGMKPNEPLALILRTALSLSFVATLGCDPAADSVREAPAPAGLAASALADSTFTWVPRIAPGFRVYFAENSYPAAHQDSLLERLPAALSHARSMINAPALDAPIDLFFIESREQMSALIGGSATGFAQPSVRAVFLVTNPEWRAFERHEIVHVVAYHAWGPPAPGNDWLNEGLAQAADGMCACHSNSDVALALAVNGGWISLDTILSNFRAQPDLRAYLQAASFVDYLLQRFGPVAIADLWKKGSRSDSVISGHTLQTIEREWREQLRLRDNVSPGTLLDVESKGCG